MSLFKSRREKQMWLYALAVLIAILSTMAEIPGLKRLAGNQELLTGLFIAGMFMISGAVLLHGLRSKPGKVEVAVWLGIIAVYMLLFLRLSVAAERGHLIEYSVLAILIHKALRERARHVETMTQPALIAMVIAVSIGLIDEGLQYFIPNRVFDPLDMVINTLAGSLAIISTVVLMWVRKKFSKS